MAHFVIWFRYVNSELIYPFDGKRKWKSLKQNNLMINVWKDRKISFNIIFDELYLSNNDDIVENKIISSFGMMEAIKLWIEGKMDEDDSKNEDVNEFEELCDKWDYFFNKEYNKNDTSNEFIKWIKTENYKTIKNLLNENDSLLHTKIIAGIKEGSTIESVEENIKVFINDDNLEEIMNLIKNKKQNKKEIKLNAKNEKKKIKKEEEVKKKIEIEMKKEEEMKIKMNLKNKNNENVKKNYKNKDKPKSEKALKIISNPVSSAEPNSAKDEENIKITQELSKNDDEINEEKKKIKYFIEDKNLFEIFNKFNKGKTEIGRNLLNICIFANEIGKRFEFFEKLKLKNKLVFNVYFEEEKFLEIEKTWKEIKEKSLKNIEEIEKELKLLLINLLPLFEKNEILEKDLVNKMKEKLYFQKICEYFIYTKEQNMNGKLTKNQINFVQEMLNLNEKGHRFSNWVEKIEERINKLIKMEEQIKLDNQRNNEDYLNPEGYKPLLFEETEINEESNSEPNNFREFERNDPMALINNLYSNRRNIINPKEFFQTLFNKWITLTKNKNFGLLIASPYNKIGGHIQAIIVAVGTGKGEEEEKMKAKQIFNGKPNTFCRPPFMFNCSDKSLFCYLCKKSRFVNKLRRSPSSDEFIQFEIQTTEINITFVHKPETRIVPQDSSWIESLMKKLSNNLNKESGNGEPQNALITLHNLALFKSYEYLENLIENVNEREKLIFIQAFIALKNWAKGYCIYGSQFGFLDGNSISIMLTKVFLLNPGANYHELIERFFLTFVTCVVYGRQPLV
uniref:Poly(A) polymerase central domain-containing protein n=1 Tax=Meloidogyne enterolobii TaxID=390850 RepID=A0A6V7VUY2_MELEN|nr:unnamed protein product [Meloidogyne enterolobii]